MFIEFSVSNFRSIGEKQILSLIPAPKQREFLDNIINDGRNRSLNAVAIYGANGSGKSNILRAMEIFKHVIFSSARISSTSYLSYDPFLLREGWDEKPTHFEIIFVTQKHRYRYGFEYDLHEIRREWLYRKSAGREVFVFEREGEVIDTSSGFQGSSRAINAAIEATRANALFLSTCDTLNVDEAKWIIEWFFRNIHIDGLQTEKYGTEKLFEDEEMRKGINNYLTRLNLGITGIVVEKDEDITSGSGIRMAYKIFAQHNSYTKNGKLRKNSVLWDYIDRESSGSIKALQLGGPIVSALMTGGVLIIDEIEAKLHPLITLDTINLFLNNKTNPLKAQLIFATHDTNLLSYSDLRRDQIYFAEKNNWESTEVYSLSDFVYLGCDKKQGKERPDTDKEKRYIEGRYGAIPVLGPLMEIKFKEDGQKG